MILTEAVTIFSTLRLLVFSHVSSDGAADLSASFVLSEVIHKLSVRSHQVHDDGVIHLTTAGIRGFYPSRFTSIFK